MKRLIAIALVCAALSACRKKAPEEIPQPKAGGMPPAVGVSTSASGANLLFAPRNYIRTSIGQIEKAKAAKALYEKTAAKELKTQDLEAAGGN